MNKNRSLQQFGLNDVLSDEERFKISNIATECLMIATKKTNYFKAWSIDEKKHIRELHEVFSQKELIKMIENGTIYNVGDNFYMH